MPRRNSDPDVYVSLCGMIRKPFAKSQETLFPLQIPIAREVIWVGGAGGGALAGWLVGGVLGGCLFFYYQVIKCWELGRSNFIKDRAEKPKKSL